jgi:hypothetical protein
MVSPPEYEATTQPEAKMECDKDFLGEIILKQIESNLIPTIFNLLIRLTVKVEFHYLKIHIIPHFIDFQVCVV